MTTNVLPMEVARKPPRAKPSKPPATAAVPKVSAKTAQRVTWQRRSAALLGTVASAMTVVSLTHIAGGVQLITHDAVPAWQAWGVAVGLDINYIAMEMAVTRSLPSSSAPPDQDVDMWIVCAPVVYRDPIELGGEIAFGIGPLARA